MSGCVVVEPYKHLQVHAIHKLAEYSLNQQGQQHLTGISSRSVF